MRYRQKALGIGCGVLYLLTGRFIGTKEFGLDEDEEQLRRTMAQWSFQQAVAWNLARFLAWMAVLVFCLVAYRCAS